MIQSAKICDFIAFFLTFRQKTPTQARPNSINFDIFRPAGKVYQGAPLLSHIISVSIGVARKQSIL